MSIQITPEQVAEAIAALHQHDPQIWQLTVDLAGGSTTNHLTRFMSPEPLWMPCILLSRLYRSYEQLQTHTRQCMRLS